MNQKQITNMLHNDLCAEWYEDNYDRSLTYYDLDLFFDNLDGTSISDKKDEQHNINFKDYLQVYDLTEKKFFDKWLGIIRETKKGNEYIDKVIDYQNDSIGSWIGFKRAKKYTDEEIKEFFRNCWYS